jgi:aminoglycoside 3-N-acetyltransferase|tara:strand:- start:1180 stop:2193 length:1014 start_codon:yes stop_codon:yes gene_type:complete
MGINNISEFKEIVWDLFGDRFIDNGYPTLMDMDLNLALLEKGLIDSLDLLNLAIALRKQNIYLDLSVSEGEIDTSISGLFSMLRLAEDSLQKKVEPDGIKHVLKDLGVQRGDNLLLHSSFNTISSLVDTPKEAVDDIFDIIGARGTLLVPAVNFDAFKQGLFDSENTAVHSNLGAINECVRNISGAVRSINPFDSMCGVGPLAEEICGGYNEQCYGEESPWKKALNHNFKLLMIGVDFYYASIVHAVEVDAKVPYRKWMDFRNNILHKGVKSDFTVRLYAAELGMKRNYNKIMDEFLNSGDMLRKSKYTKAYLIDLEYMYNHFLAKIKDNPYIFVSS